MEKKIETTFVYSVNDEMVIANSIEQAIEIYREYYTDGEVRKIEQVRNNSYGNEYGALIRR